MSIQDILDIIGEEENARIDMEERFKEVYENISTVPQNINEISKRVNKNISEVNEILFMLEIEGFIESLPGDKYVIKE